MRWDKDSTHTKDRASFLPIEAAAELASEGLFGGLTTRFHGVPTEYSQRKTLTEDAPEILARVHEDGADAAVLCPLCPVCHQTVSLVGRHLEANELPLLLSSDRRGTLSSIAVSRGSISRILPLGNPCGHPWQPDMQREIVRQALSLFENRQDFREPQSRHRSPGRKTVRCGAHDTAVSIPATRSICSRLVRNDVDNKQWQSR